MSPSLLEVRELSIGFAAARGVVSAVERLSFDIAPGETLALVGESGCGKTVTGLSLMGLLPSARIGGSARLAGQEVLGLTPRQRRKHRGAPIAMVFQDPLTSLNPVMTIGAQLVEAIRADRPVSRREAADYALHLLERVRIPAPRQRLGEYPHRLSGGMRQRVVIALALAQRPALLIADEPTTALDVTIQAQILQLLLELKNENGMALLLITHDLAVVSETADRVLVMRHGQAVEEQPVIPFFEAPRHPYSRGLIAARPQPRPRFGPRPRLPELVDSGEFAG
ncbi:peptide/nickel transport system ATP-binding protein [Angulomicrobium tetraedrale]|uniref:Peptide/nickel transport system ATP-binding protein n=1 Tax=Ancylobacter tetraedralis TaxID=217068 RepID=A0A839Z330_9HYPH|nr:ABC transporter ATP-binding protein [Ancylobacter tetraedralis]MBB3770029.1 peptide/nickel transport system ATP-binding protein [Ancylobacter tetraedralis]